MNRIFLLIIAFAWIVLEVVCAKLAFDTLGEVYSSLYFIVIAFNIVPIILIILNKNKSLALFLFFFLGLAIIPYQLYLGQRFLLLQQEGSNITGYLYGQKIHQQNYPNDLSGYTFTFPELKQFFTYNKDANNEFHLSYSIGTSNTSHSYDSNTGKWGYYPD